MAPWELERAPEKWLDRIVMAMNAKGEARAEARAYRDEAAELGGMDPDEDGSGW